MTAAHSHTRRVRVASGYVSGALEAEWERLVTALTAEVPDGIEPVERNYGNQHVSGRVWEARWREGRRHEGLLRVALTMHSDGSTMLAHTTALPPHTVTVRTTVNGVAVPGEQKAVLPAYLCRVTIRSIAVPGPVAATEVTCALEGQGIDLSESGRFVAGRLAAVSRRAHRAARTVGWV